MHNVCLDCFWCEQCGGDTPCSFFDDVNEDNYESMIEKERIKFFSEYEKYNEEFYKE